MNVAFLYPQSLLNPNSVDEIYQAEYLIAQRAGLSVHKFDIENIETSIVSPKIPDDAQIVYRGWMLNADSYDKLERRFGKQLVTSKQDYLNAHYLPNWYNELESLTISSIITNEINILNDFKNFSDKAFCKDFVKSLKTGKGSIIETVEDIPRLLQDMQKYRGHIEGGIVLRKVVNLLPDSETRFFVVNNHLFSPAKNDDKCAIAQEVTRLLSHKNLKFYSIDIASTVEGKNILIEIGDGQVSDYVGWPLDRFVSVLAYFTQF